jgi:pSer/pThr/pTyr-binding forkhead associated (FHA) protein
MSDASVLLLRLGFLALLWLFVLLAIGMLRGDLAVRARGGKRPAKRPATKAAQPVAAPAAAPAVAAAVPAPTKKRSRGSAAALVIRDADGERRVPLTGEPVTFGRNADNSVVVHDDYASGHHCRLAPGGKGWQLEDLGSTNGTFLRDKRINGTVPAPIGTRFTIGRTEVTVE